MDRVARYVVEQIKADGAAFLNHEVAFEIRPDLWVSLEDARIAMEADGLFEKLKRSLEFRLFEIRRIDGSERLTVAVLPELDLTDPGIWGLLSLRRRPVAVTTH